MKYQNLHISKSLRQFLLGPIRTLTEAVPKERAAGLPVFAVALRCVPYIVPEHWEGSKLADELPGDSLRPLCFALSDSDLGSVFWSRRAVSYWIL